MLTVNELAKSFGGRVLFDNVSLQINSGERMGLVGPNGAGKSTLFQLLLRNEEPDAGEISIQRGIRMGFLPQETAPAGEETVLDLALGLSSENHHLHASHQTEAKAKRILSGLGFRQEEFGKKSKELSGGWIMRAHLARLLVDEPDILLLDEPTNHLDLHTLLWFQEYLQSYPGAILVISHDREFLNRLVNSILEIRQCRIFRYRGNYDDYLVQKKAQEEQQWSAYKNQQREIAHLMEFVNRFRAKNTKAAQAQSKLKQIERMEKIEPPASAEATVDFNFPQPQRSGLKAVTLSEIHHAYGDNVVYRGIDFQAERGEKIVLVGPNGAGKSTLLKLLAGVLPVQKGERELGHNVLSGYYSQYRIDMLEADRTVLEEALETPQRVTEQQVRTLLGCFLFRGDDVFKKVKVLSGGEKSRLALVKLLLNPPNLLLMDEPTTHLDIPSIDALIQALGNYEGTLIFISHDVYFIRSLANKVIHVNQGRLTTYPGDYQYYLEKTGQTSARAGLTAGQAPQEIPRGIQKQPGISSKDRRRLEAEERQKKSNRLREQKKLVSNAEAKIHELEERQRELARELEDPETYNTPGRAMQLNREILSIVEDLHQTTGEWEKAASVLLEMEKQD